MYAMKQNIVYMYMYVYVHLLPNTCHCTCVHAYYEYVAWVAGHGKIVPHTKVVYNNIVTVVVYSRGSILKILIVISLHGDAQLLSSIEYKC